MRAMKAAISFLGSRQLTVWMVLCFIVFYLTMAVWSREAFGTFVVGISSDVVFRVLYLLFCANVTTRAAAALWTCRRDKARFILMLPLYAGLPLLLLSFFLSINTRDFQWMIVGEGDVIRLPWEAGPYRVLHVKPAVERNTLVTADSPVFAYEPFIDIDEQSGGFHRIGAFPPKRVGATYLHILNFGLGPGVAISKGGKTVQRGEVALRLIPFGAVDSFEMRPLPYRFFVSILPNSIIKKGREAVREYDLSAPLYHVEIVKGDTVIAAGDTSGSISFDNDMSIAFSPPADWVHLEAVHDPFRFWFITGLALTAVGIAVYPVRSLIRQVLHPSCLTTGKY